MVNNRSATPISQARNLGPKSSLMLREIGVLSLEELSKLGAVTCYKMLEAAHVKVSLNMLYAMYGAIHDVHWAQLPQATKDDLIAATENPISPFVN